MYQCMADILFYLFGFSCFAYVELGTNLFGGHILNSETGGQPYRDTCPCEVSKYYLLGKADRTVVPVSMSHCELSTLTNDITSNQFLR